MCEIVLALLVLISGSGARASAATVEPPPQVVAEPHRERPFRLDLDLGFAIGGIVSGAQRHLPHYPPAEDGFLAGGLGLGARCFWHRVGGEVELDVSGAEGQYNNGTASWGVFTAEILRLGTALELGRAEAGGEVAHLDFGAGANHTWLRLDDASDRAASAAGRRPGEDVATGLGYYAHLDFLIEYDIGLTSSVGVQYEYVGPRFAGSPKRFDGHTLEARFRFGWRF
jgi:hypothetical protein